jgi:hypothetical protein
VLIASGLKLLGVGTVELGWTIVAVCVTAPPLWAWARMRQGLAPVPFPARKQDPVQPLEPVSRP